MTDNPRTDFIIGRLLFWGGIAIVMAELCLLVLPSTQQIYHLVGRLFYTSGFAVGMGDWLSRHPRRSILRAIIIGVVLQIVLLITQHGIRWAIQSL